MNRRAFLGGAGVVGSLAVIGRASRRRPDQIRVRFWRSEGAAAYPSVPDRVRELRGGATDPDL
ncbi:MAG: hypothetical protein ACOCY8_01810, partial [Spirochaetota bacterium]